MLRKIPALLAITIASAAFAHTGVKDPQVMARMDGMVVLGDNTKVLSQMARGIVAYDRKAAEAAIAALTEETARVPALFEPKAADPKSESKPEIWSDWEGFLAEVKGLQTVLTSVDVSSSDALATAVRDIGRSCGSCHEAYRE